MLPVAVFWKNKSKSDGYQNHCKQCSKGRWGKTFICESCGISVYVEHRNISKRKTKYCIVCYQVFAKKRIIEQNKKDATYITYSQKGHRYILDAAKGKYRGEHRLVMEKLLSRSLTNTEIIHHIDNDPKNNEISNLWLTDNVKHRLAHNSLLPAAWDAFRMGYIIFDPKDGIYKIKK